ncbi:hypothetical protein [Spirulina sp. 06S082]|uniref:hypothetical protein n=1 Tax=Spirulina sp. 06S082 TaxID=3110248 RepID=UPI002B203E9F|nr:hypothetical protein [Spirulina sp. 06S082]
MNKPPKRPDRHRNSEEYRTPPSTNTGGTQRDRHNTNSYRDGLYRVPSLGQPKANPRKITPPISGQKLSTTSKIPPKTASKFANPPQKRLPQTVLPPKPESPSPPLKRRLNWLFNWQLWGSLLVLITGTTGFTATALLLKLPAVPNCPEMFLPTASASMRLYCAQVAANKQDAENLLYAIQLVQNLPKNHPLRPEIDRMVEEWVSEALRWGEDKYQAGDLEAAIALARQVSLHFDNKALIEERIARWQSTWSEGERIEGEIEEHLGRSAWGQAFQAAASLTKLNNRYWSTTRYDRWFERLNVAREESQKLDKAFAQLHRGGLDNLLQAIAIAEEFPEDSSAYAEARSLIEEGADRLLDLAFQKLTSGDWQGAMQVANSIPAKLNLNEEVIDINNLADAASTASYGSMANLEDAIAVARDIAPGRPLYSRSQTLIRQWQSEIEGISNLAQADRLAREGSVSSFNAAIAQARLIPANNPRYREARTKISQWQGRIDVLEAGTTDRGGIQLASARESSSINQPLFPTPREGNDGNSSASAATNSQPSRRTNNSDRDRALLNEAIAFANQGRYAEAIETLGSIDEDSDLFRDAQNRRDRWQRESQAQVVLATAYQQAATRTPNGLRAAIDTARSISGNSQVTVQSQQAIATWSAEILSLARGKARQDLQEAIAIAQQVPSNTPTYATARSQIAVWQEMLQNPPVPNLNKPPRDSP